MKKIGLICAGLLLCGSFSACGNQSNKSASSSSKDNSSLKAENSSLKKKLNHKKHKQNKKESEQNSSNSSKSNSNNNQQQSNQQQGSSQTSPSSQGQNNGVNNADDAVARAKAQYGDDGGQVQWNYMIDGDTGQPIRNADGSYFVKGTDGQSMSGTRYSVNVYPDGTITSN